MSKMKMPPLGRGPYGTNEGDCWLAPGSTIQTELDKRGDGFVLVHEMIKRDGVVQEAVYVTSTRELIKRAQEGHERYMEAVAQAN